MFGTLKRLLGVTAPVIEEEVKIAKAKIEKAEKIKPVTVTPKKPVVKKPRNETKSTLSKMTKKAIDDLAKEKFGIELDRRLTKDKMVTAFLSAQKKAK